MKKYKSIDEFISVADVPKKLWEFETLAKEKPNWNKSSDFTESKKIYQKNEYIILEVKKGKKKGFIAYNTHKTWEEGHTHLNSRSIAEIIIKNVLSKRKPKTCNMYLLRSHIRLSNDEKYIKFLKELIEVKKNKSKKIYINRKEVRK